MNDGLNTVILPSHTPDLFHLAVEKAAACLRSGGVVALPTETVYGLAANALDAEAVARLFAIKGRPAHNPVIVHVANLAMARSCVSMWPDLADRLATCFWPGPLTMVLPKAASIPDVVSAAGVTVGIRWPSHPIMRAVIEACGFPLAAPSANRSNAVSPTCPEHVLSSLAGQIPFIIDGGICQVGIESTVIDLSVDPPCLLRPGMIHASSVASVVGELVRHGGDETCSYKSPGMLRKHYAPRARLRLMAWEDTGDLQRQLAASAVPTHRIHVIAHTHIPAPEGWGRVSVIPHDPEAFARALYGEFHVCDEEGAGLIVLEEVPATPEWEGISDRLRRAAS